MSKKVSSGMQRETICLNMMSRSLRNLATQVAYEDSMAAKNKPVKEKKRDARILLPDDVVLEIRTKHQKEGWCSREILRAYGEKWKLSEKYIYDLLAYTVRSKLVVY